MIKVENLETFGFRAALRGMRNPLNSWGRADSVFGQAGNILHLGEHDANLIKSLSKAGRSHRKMLRMMHVQCDITAPLYWWKDYDTYKVATVANGCSTMHKLHANEFSLSDFSIEGLDERALISLKNTIDDLNYYRQKFIDSGNKDMEAWHCMNKLLTHSFEQKRTIDINYETALSIILDRNKHKLQEFRDLCDILREELPLMNLIVEAVKGGNQN